MWMRAASSAAPTAAGACGLGAAGAATADRVFSFRRCGRGSGGARERRVGPRGCGAVGGESCGVGFARGEAVEARVVEADGGDAQLGAPEVLAPAAVAVTRPVGADEFRDLPLAVAALGEHLDGAGDLRQARVVESFAG